MGLLIISNDNKLSPNVKRTPTKKSTSNVSNRTALIRANNRRARNSASPKKTSSNIPTPASDLEDSSEFTYISEDSGLGAESIMSHDKKEAPVEEGHTVLPIEESELAVAACTPVAVPVAADAVESREASKAQPINQNGPPSSAQTGVSSYRRVDRCPTPVWFAPERPPTPLKRKIGSPTATTPGLGSFDADEKRRRVEGGTKSPLEELSALGSRSPDQFSSSNSAMQPVFTAFDSNLDDANQDFGVDGFDSDSMDSDESDSSLPSDEESDSDIDSDSAEWFESGPPRIDEEMCRKNWNQHVFASKSQSWGSEKRVTDNCGKPNCPCGDELYLRRRNAYHRRRQVVFNLSVSKLGRYRQAANPSLLRSVLVCNTLRNLEKEFEKEGVRFSVGAHGNLLITRSCPPNRCNNRPPATWSQRRVMRMNAQQQQQQQQHQQQHHQQQQQQQQQHQQQAQHHHYHHHHQQQHPHHHQHHHQQAQQQHQHLQQQHQHQQQQQPPHHPSPHDQAQYWNRDCGNCGNCANCVNMRSSHCFHCGKPHSICRNLCRDYRSEWQDYRQSDYDYWQRCRYRRPGFNRWPSPTPRYPADYKERAYRDYRDDYFDGSNRNSTGNNNNNNNNNNNHRSDGFQGYHEGSDWAQGSPQQNLTYVYRYASPLPRIGSAGPKDVSTVDDRGIQRDLCRDYNKDPASSVLFADLNEDSGRLTPFVAFRDEPLTDYDTVDRLLNSVSVLNFGNTVPVATPVAADDTSDMTNSQLLTLTAPWKSPPHAEGQENQTAQDQARNSTLPQDNQLLTLTTPWKSPPHDNPMYSSTSSSSGDKVQTPPHDMENSSYVDPIASQDRYDLYSKPQTTQSLQPTNCYQDFHQQPQQQPQQQQQQAPQQQQQQTVSYPLQDMTPRYANCGKDWEGEWNQEWPSYWGMPEEGRSVLAS